MSHSLLVIDDDPWVSRFIRRAAERMGIVVTEIPALDGLESAIATGRPELVMLDLTLPGVARAELYPRLVAAGVTVPVLLMSGDSEAALFEAAGHARAAGLDVPETVAKPVRLADLQATLARHLPLDA